MTIICNRFTMGRHKEWRKIAKRERRRRIRCQKAKDQDGSCLTPEEYEKWSKEQEYLELLEYEQIERTNAEENRKWLAAEKIAMEQWQKLQEIREKIRQQRLEQEAKLKLELELEQKRRKEEEERLKQIEEENKRKQEIFMENLDNFLSGDSDPPAELFVGHETKPQMPLCPFFSKTGCCRYGDQCSRNHKYPGITKVLLATNLYIHFGLDNATSNEYDTDVMLEFEDRDTYRDFTEFFYDVLPEFEKFGRVVQFKVCHNVEKHLRGNTYVEFAELRHAVAAYRALHARWYGGRQLSLQFCTINSWHSAVCGLQSGRRCPKGRGCNYLHVFRNPNNLFLNYNQPTNQDSERTKRTPPRSWRWSESPEVETPRRRKSKSKERSTSRSRREEKKRDHRKRSRRNRTRSPRKKSSERRKDRK